MKDILRLSNVVARDILKLLLNGSSLSPRQLARKLDVPPQSVRNALVHLKATSLVDNRNYGEYTITELGREVIERLSQPSDDQSSEEHQQ